MDELQKRKTPRYQSYDYNRAGAYFITICTQNRQCILSRIVGTGVLDCPRPELTEYGRIAEKYIRQLNDFYNHISVDGYVIMPNHIHLLLLIKEDRMDNGQSGTPVPTSGENENRIGNGQSRTPVPTNVARANSTCAQFISTLKRFCNKEYGKNIWQARFYDHIIRSRDDYNEHISYIDENPVRWFYDELYAAE